MLRSFYYSIGTARIQGASACSAKTPYCRLMCRNGKKVLAASKDHPGVERTHEQVKKTFPTTSLATIYKTIALIKEVQEILEIRFSESSRFDGNKPYPHPHIICLKCNKIIDPELMDLEKFTEEAAARTGFRITAHRLDFFGICPECQEKE